MSKSARPPVWLSVHFSRFDMLTPRAGSWRTPGSRGLLHLATDVDGTQVEKVDPLVNEQDDLLAGAWPLLGLRRDTDQIATVLPHQHNRLSLRHVVAGKTEACARNPLEQISRAPGIDVPGDSLHERSS